MNDEGQPARGANGDADERDDARLWELLGRVPRREPGPYFARRVLREVALHERAAARSAQESNPLAGAGWFARLAGLRRALPFALAPLAAVFLLFLGLRLDDGRRAARPASGAETAADFAPATPAGDAPALGDSVAPTGPATPETPPLSLAATLAAVPDDFSVQDVEVVADLDTLLKREENRLWTEDTARF